MRTVEEFNKKTGNNLTAEEYSKLRMVEPEDPSWIDNNEEQKKHREQEGGKGWANNLDAQHIIAIGKDMYDGDMDKVNEVLKENGYKEISSRPKEGDDLYIDF